MLRRDVGYTEGFASALLALRRDVKYCKVCHNICDDDVCAICVDCQRDHSTICVVENIIFVLENGRLKEEGTHSELLQADRLYAHLWNIQNETEQWQMKTSGIQREGGESYA